MIETPTLNGRKWNEGNYVMRFKWIYLIGRENHLQGKWPHICSPPSDPRQLRTSYDSQCGGKTGELLESNSYIRTVEGVRINVCWLGLLHINLYIGVT